MPTASPTSNERPVGKIFGRGLLLMCLFTLVDAGSYAVKQNGGDAEEEDSVQVAIHSHPPTSPYSSHLPTLHTGSTPPECAKRCA